MNRVEQMMKYHGFTRQELCAKSGVSEPQLSKIIRDLHSPSLRQVRALADALDVPMDYLFPKQEATA